MNNQNDSTTNSSAQAAGGWTKPVLRMLFSFLVPICIVIFALGAYVYQMETRPRAQRQKPPRQARLVTVETMHKTDGAAKVSAMGTVQAAREITIRPEVTGVITEINPVVLPGGIIREGQVLYEIDSRDYQAVVRQRESEVQRARLNWKLESGSQTIAQKEYSMLEEIIEETDIDLVLRKPHLEEAQAAMEAAEAVLNKAKLDVERCTIRAPFNAVIKEKFADLGARVSPADPLISAIGIDEFWVEVKVHVDQLSWIEIPQANEQDGSEVHIYNPTVWEQQVYRKGRVIRLLGQLEEQGRMARLLTAVRDPLSLESNEAPPLLIGSYVQAEIQGRRIPEVFPIQRQYLRNGSQVWIMNEDSELEIRTAEIVFRSKDTVYIRNGFQEGDKIVTTDLSAPVAGMPLRTESDLPEENASAPDSRRQQE